MELDGVYYQIQYILFIDTKSSGYTDWVNMDFAFEENDPSKYLIASYMDVADDGEILGYFGDAFPKLLENKKDLLFQRRRVIDFGTSTLPVKLFDIQEGISSYVQLNSKNLYNKLDTIGKSHFLGEHPFTGNSGRIFRAFDWVFLRFKGVINTAKGDEKFNYIKGYIPISNKVINRDTHNEKYFFEKPDPIYQLKSHDNSKPIALHMSSNFRNSYNNNSDYFEEIDLEYNLEEVTNFFTKENFYDYNKDSKLFLLPEDNQILINSNFCNTEKIEIDLPNDFALIYPIDSNGNNRTFTIKLPPKEIIPIQEFLYWDIKINDNITSNLEAFYNSDDIGLNILNEAQITTINKNIPVSLTLLDNTVFVENSGVEIDGKYNTTYNSSQIGYYVKQPTNASKTLKSWENNDSLDGTNKYYKFYSTKSTINLNRDTNNATYYYIREDIYKKILSIDCTEENWYGEWYHPRRGASSLTFYKLSKFIENSDNESSPIIERTSSTTMSEIKMDNIDIGTLIRGTYLLQSSKLWPSTTKLTLETFDLGEDKIVNSFDEFPDYKQPVFYNYKIKNLLTQKYIVNSENIYTADLNFEIPFLKEGQYKLDAEVQNILGMKAKASQTFNVKTKDFSSFKKPNLTQLKDSGIHIDWSNIPFLYANFSKGSPQDEDFYYNYPAPPIYEKDENGNIKYDSNNKPIISASFKSYVIPQSQNINFNLLGQSCNYLAYCFQPIGQEFGVDTTRKVMTLYGGDYKYEFSTCLIDSSDLTLNIKCYNINTGEQISPSNNEGDEGFIKITLPNDNTLSLQYSDQLYYIWLLDKANRKMYFKIYYNTNDSNILNGQAVSEINFGWNFIEASLDGDSSTELRVPESREWYNIFEPIQITLEENQVVSYLIATNQEGIKIDDLNLTSARDYNSETKDIFSFNPNRSNVGYIAENKSQEDISHATIVRVDNINNEYKVVYDGDSYINNFIDYSAPNNIECYYEVYLGETAEAPYRTDVINTGDLGKWFLIVADDYFGPEGYDENKVIVSDIFEFEANVSFGNMSTNTDFSISKNFTKYPKVQRSYANYWSGTLSGLLGVIGEGGRYIQTIDMLNKFKQLGIDPRRKFLKDREGNLWEVAISAAPTIETNIKLDVQLRTKSISWVEVADTTPTMIYLEDYSKATWLENNIARPVGEYNGRTQF